MCGFDEELVTRRDAKPFRGNNWVYHFLAFGRGEKLHAINRLKRIQIARGTPRTCTYSIRIPPLPRSRGGRNLSRLSVMDMGRGSIDHHAIAMVGGSSESSSGRATSE